MPLTSELPTMVELLKVRRESADTVTLRLAHAMPFEPGQFVLVWLPRRDEKPYTVSAHAQDWIEITVRSRGKFSTALTELGPGARVGIRGPYGVGFRPEQPLVIVAGGCGIAPVAPLKDAFPRAEFIAGARTKDELIFTKRFPDMILCTDDGSAGQHAFPTALLRRRLKDGGVKTVCTCGPELMMRAVFDLCEEMNVQCQAGLERYMKCGFGICGQCTCGDRLVCRDGPVFDSDALRRMPEFGRVARLKDGRKVSVQEYSDWCSV